MTGKTNPDTPAPLRAVGILGADLANVRRLQVVAAYCDRHGYEMVGVAHDPTEALAMIAAGTADMAVVGDRSWLLSGPVEVVTDERYRSRSGPEQPQAQGRRSPGQRPERLR